MAVSDRDSGVRSRGEGPPTRGPQGEENRDHETDDHHAGLRRWSDAGKRRPNVLDGGFERARWARPLFDSEAMTFVDQVCQTADLEIGWGYMKQVGIVGDDRSSRRQPLRPRSEGKFSRKEI